MFAMSAAKTAHIYKSAGSRQFRLSKQSRRLIPLDAGPIMFHDICFSDLEFERIPAVFCSTRGVRQFRSLQVGMPRIPQPVINSVFYLYGSRADAQSGLNPGGTGFIVQYRGTAQKEVKGAHFYGVTNWHVALRDGFSTIRLNTVDGGIDVIELDPSEWHFLPRKYDLAVVPLSLDRDIHQVSSVSSLSFAEPPEKRLAWNVPPQIGVGDDVFMVGLFVDHVGVTTNVPSARFGNVSMLANPNATMKQPTGYTGESYVVDMHSRTGFSGSPVYAYRTFGSDLTDNRGTRFDQLSIDRLGDVISQASQRGTIPSKFSGYIRAPQMLTLLGVLWGQFPERWELREKSPLDQGRKDLITEGAYVQGMSGMTCVIPAWQILELLEIPELEKLRQPEIARYQSMVEQHMAKYRQEKPLAQSAKPKSPL